MRFGSPFRAAAATFIVAGTLLTTNQVDASAGDRALNIMHMHTREQATIVFKRNGRYDPAGLKKLNYILRDWRKDEPINMDPHLFDLIWEVYQKSGSHEPIHVVCGYRSPDTNNMLRARSRGVAKHSQHMLGKAMDFYIPDVPLTKLREIGFKMQMGGVGFYPTSGSPFVHMDTGNVRSWPRMSREQLVRLFPDGKTMHIPADGKPLPGYAQALASYQARKAGQGDIVMASAGGSGGKSFLARLFGGGADEEEDTADAGATSVKVAAAKGAKTAPAADDDEGGDAAPAAVAATPAAAPIPAPKAVPATDDATSDQTVVAMAPLPRPSPAPRQDAADGVADAQVADAATSAAPETTDVAMAPLPRPSPAPHAAEAEPAPALVADAAPAPLPKASPVAQPTVSLASASATGGATARTALPQLAAYQASPATAAPAAAHQPMTAAEAIADAVGQGNQGGAAAVLAYAPSDDGAARIDARTGAIVAGHATRSAAKASAAPATNDAWQNPLARFTAVAFDNDAMALVVDPETLAEGPDGQMQMPRPLPDAAVYVVTKHGSKYGFGRVGAFRVLRSDRQPASDTLVFASNAN